MSLNKDDVKTIKTKLKEAKEAIKSKQYNSAIKLCKDILKDDADNYVALVLFGAALQESDKKNEACKYFKNAIKISPEQILAWQGLASYYEKNDDCNGDLFSVYTHLLQLEKDYKKWRDVLEKLERYAKKTNEICTAVSILHAFIGDNCEYRINVMEVLVRLFTQIKDVPQTLVPIYEEILQVVINDSQHTYHKEFYKRYLKLLYAKKEYCKLFISCEKMLEIYKMDVYPLEWICKLYYELCTAGTISMVDGLEESVQKYCDQLLSLNNEAVVGLVANGIRCFCSEDYCSSKEFLNTAVEIKADFWQAWYWLCRAQMMLHCFTAALHSASKCRILLPLEMTDHITTLNTLNLEALSKSEEQQKCEQCIDKCSEVLGSDPENKFALECFVRSAIFVGKFDLALSSLNKLKELQKNVVDEDLVLLEALYKFKSNLFDEAESILIDFSRKSSQISTDSWLLLGLIYCEKNNYSEAFDSFLKAAKLTPYVYTVFIHLGQFYRDITGDLEKARRCYQKAFQLNPHSDISGIALSDLYRQLQRPEDNFELLKVATKTDGSKKWAWLRLGLQYLDVGDTAQAVDCLRYTIRLDPNDSHCWECLADACLARGSYASSLRCYAQCVKLNGSSIYPVLQLANIKQLIGSYDESLNEYRLLLAQYPHYIPALKGYSETCLLKARELLEKRIVGDCKDYCQEAVTALTNVLKEDNSLSCLWKLLADVCVTVAQLPPHLNDLSVSSLFVTDNHSPSHSEHNIVLNKTQLRDLALKCYFLVLNLNQHNADIIHFIYHDIGYCYNIQADDANDPSVKTNLRLKALSAVKKSVLLNGKFWQHWNLLGVIALSSELKNLPLAQHCFIKSIQAERKNVIPWCNLGVLYLCSNDINLANEVFAIAQSIDPEYARSWTGQALIAESVDHRETLDLFYHTTQLSYHPESCRGFAECIINVLKNWNQYKSDAMCYYIIEKLKSVQLAITTLTWYTVEFPEDGHALNMLGILLEWNNMIVSGCSATEKALAHTDDENEQNVFCNLGRLYFKLGKYDDSIAMYKEIKNSDLAVQCGLAIAQFKAGYFEDSCTTYENAMHWYDIGGDYKNELSFALASIIYVSKGDQDVFFQCLQMEPVSVHGTFAACALGMLTGNLGLSMLALKEMNKFQAEMEYVHHIAMFTSYIHSFQGKYKEAIRCMSKFIYKYPGNTPLWISFCLLLLHYVCDTNSQQEQLGLAAASHVQHAISLGRMVVDVSKMYSVIGLCYLLCNKPKESLLSCAKGVHIYPNVPENWAIFIAVQYARGINVNIIKKYISFLRRRMDCSKNLSLWLSNMERKVSTF